MLGSSGWLDGASWDGANMMQRVNNLPMWIGPRVVFGWCRSAAPCLTGGRISTVLYFWDRCAHHLALRSRLLWSWQRNLEQALTSNIL